EDAGRVPGDEVPVRRGSSADEIVRRADDDGVAVRLREGAGRIGAQEVAAEYVAARPRRVNSNRPSVDDQALHRAPGPRDGEAHAEAAPDCRSVQLDAQDGVRADCAGVHGRTGLRVAV